MPFARLTLAGFSLASDRRAALAARVADLIDRTLRKDAARTAVLVEEAPSPAAWVGGGPAPGLAHLEVIVTAGTNPPAEKAAFVAAADAFLREALGPLPEVTYAVVRELTADAWGFGGRTQEDRKAARERT